MELILPHVNGESVSVFTVSVALKKKKKKPAILSVRILGHCQLVVFAKRKCLQRAALLAFSFSFAKETKAPASGLGAEAALPAFVPRRRRGRRRGEAAVWGMGRSAVLKRCFSW